jgi:hypothetical protein
MAVAIVLSVFLAMFMFTAKLYNAATRDDRFRELMQRANPKLANWYGALSILALAALTATALMRI